MKTLGLIGGTSWHATVEYYREINQKVGKKIGSQANPTLVIYSLNIELMRNGTRKEIIAEYLRIANLLIDAGAQGIVICANTPHMVVDDIQPKISKPILHIGDAVGKAAKEKGLSKIALLGTLATMNGTFISNYIEEKYGIDVLTPKEEHKQGVHDKISKELTQGIFKEETKQFFIAEMNHLKKAGAEGIILGCTELPILMQGVTHELPFLDTTGLHINDAVSFILND